MKWNATEWNATKWNGMEWYDMEWNITRTATAGRPPLICYIICPSTFSYVSPFFNQPFVISLKSIKPFSGIVLCLLFCAFDSIRFDAINTKRNETKFLLVGNNNSCHDNDMSEYETIQYETIRNDTKRYNTIQYNTIQSNPIQYNTIRYDTIRYDTIRYKRN